MIEKLKEYGLDKYESLAYSTLLEIGLSTSSIISKKSNVPYGRIYSVLSSLESKGFVKIYLGTPKRFMAIEPRIILNKIIDKKIIEMSNIKDKNLKFIQELEKSTKREIKKPLEIINIIEGKKNYLNLSVKLHKKVKKEWRTINRLPIYQPHLQAYKDMIKKGVKGRVLTHVTDKNRKNLEIWKRMGVKIRNLNVIPSRFTVIDDTDVILRLSGAEIGGYISLHIQNPSLAKTLSDYFDELWGKAMLL
jgi:HTH-type transcriptional regulator, sugar sensing transcriptional regulator